MARLIEKREMFNAAIVTAMDCGDQLSPVCYTARNTAFDGYCAYIVEVMHIHFCQKQNQILMQIQVGILH